MRLIRAADPRLVDEIALGADAYVDGLYGCFRIDNPLGESFREEREVEVLGGTGKKVRVRVPARMRRELPPDTKVLQTDLLRVGALGENLDTLFLLSMRFGWNQREEDVVRMSRVDPAGCFIARIAAPHGDIPAGTAVVTPLSGTLAWIGMVLVHPELQRQGVASALMRACVAHALVQGTTVIGLDATPAGSGLYSSLGFVESCRIWRVSFPVRKLAEASRVGVTDFREEDLPGMARCDSEENLARHEILRGPVGGEAPRSLVARDHNGDVEGYCMTRPGRLRPFIGPLTAKTPEVAGRLLAAASHALLAQGIEEAWMDSPEGVFAYQGAAGAAPSGHRLVPDCQCVRPLTRMYRVVGAMGAEEAREFMERERREILPRTWGTSGPEKG